jgi:hypothetical protein
MTSPEPVAAAPTPGSTDIPVVSHLLRMLRVLVTPTAVFEEQRQAPAFWVPWLILCVLLLAVTFLSFPYQLAAARLGAAASGRPFPDAAVGIMKVSMVIGVPLVTLVMMLLTAGVMYLVLMGAGGEVRYKGLLSVAVFAGAALGVLQVLATFAVLKLRGPEGLTTMADYQVSFGLDLLLPADAKVPRFVEGLLRGITPFSLWGFALTAIGIRTVERTSKGAAWLAASVSLILGLLIAAFSAKAFGPK